MPKVLSWPRTDYELLGTANCHVYVFHEPPRIEARPIPLGDRSTLNPGDRITALGGRKTSAGFPRLHLAAGHLEYLGLHHDRAEDATAVLFRWSECPEPNVLYGGFLLDLDDHPTQLVYCTHAHAGRIIETTTVVRVPPPEPQPMTTAKRGRGRPAVGDRPMTPAERKARERERRRLEPWLFDDLVTAALGRAAVIAWEDLSPDVRRKITFVTIAILARDGHAAAQDIEPAQVHEIPHAVMQAAADGVREAKDRLGLAPRPGVDLSGLYEDDGKYEVRKILGAAQADEDHAAYRCVLDPLCDYIDKPAGWQHGYLERAAEIRQGEP